MEANDVTRYMLGARWQALQRAAGEEYQERRMGRACELYREALDVAESLQDEKIIAHTRSRLATSLYQAGALKEALVVLGPVVEREVRVGDPRVVFGCLVQSMEVAQELPARLSAVEKIHGHTRRLLQGMGLERWRHELLVFQSRLLFDRGATAEARKVGEEGWALKKADLGTEWSYGQVADFHLDNLVMICLAQNDIEAAESYLGEWEGLEGIMPANRLVRWNKCAAAVRLASGDHDEAVRYSELAVRHSEGSGYEETWLSARQYLVRCQLASGLEEAARPVLASLASARRSERSRARLSFYLLLGEYYARRLKESPEDRRLRVRGGRAIKLALAEGRRLDELIRGKRWVEEVETVERQIAEG